MSKIVIFDTETTGLAVKDRIIQVGAIVVDLKNPKYIEVHNELCSSEIPISLTSMAIHGIRQKDIDDKVQYADTNFKQALDNYNKIDNYLVAHNLDFDKKMIEKEGFINEFSLIDTYQCAIHLYDTGEIINDMELPNYKLQSFRYILFSEEEEKIEAEKYGVEIQAHDAIGDVVILKMFFKKLYERAAIKYKFKLSDSESILNKLVELTKKDALLNHMSYGKYSGKTFSEIENITTLNKFNQQEGPSYINWLFKDLTEKKNKKESFDRNLLYTIDTIINNRNKDGMNTSQGINF